jgi:hypothetical protein
MKNRWVPNSGMNIDSGMGSDCGMTVIAEWWKEPATLLLLNRFSHLTTFSLFKLINVSFIVSL